MSLEVLRFSRKGGHTEFRNVWKGKKSLGKILYFSFLHEGCWWFCDLHSRCYWGLALVWLVHMHSGQCRAAMLCPCMRSHLQMSRGRPTEQGWGEEGKTQTVSVQFEIINLISLLLILPIHIILLLKTSCWMSYSLFYRLPGDTSPTPAYVIYHIPCKTLHSWVPELLVPPSTHWSLPFPPLPQVISNSAGHSKHLLTKLSSQEDVRGFMYIRKRTKNNWLGKTFTHNFWLSLRQSFCKGFIGQIGSAVSAYCPPYLNKACVCLYSCACSCGSPRDPTSLQFLYIPFIIYQHTNVHRMKL